MNTSFFTIPDPDLTQESSVDPMGLQIIWTAYGQEIFGDRLTTIANDLRVYTFNIFHNHIINILYRNYFEYIQQAKNEYTTWRTDLEVKTGLLIFMEDLVTWVFYCADESSEVNKIGILGMTKARIAINSTPANKIFLAASKRQGLLKNQLNLGMTGRYKGPMLSMGYFDRTFEVSAKHALQWTQVDRLINGWQEAQLLEKLVIKLITETLFESKNKDYPLISLEELKAKSLWKKISESYVSCFGSEVLNKDVRAYWKDKLGLAKGAPMALYKEIAELKPGENINHYSVLSNALKHVASEPAEYVKIQNIIKLEPFLSHAEYLLRYIAQPGFKSISDDEQELKQLRQAIIAASQSRPEHETPRLKVLYSVMLAEGELQEWIMGILKFHKKVIDDRGGTAWVDIDERQNAKHFFSPTLNKDYNSIPKYLAAKPWWHTYYLESLSLIHNGLQ